MTVKPSVCVFVFIRESVCVCVCDCVLVCPHTYTNCGVSYRGTLNPFFVPRKTKKNNQKKENTSDFLILIIWLQVFLNPNLNSPGKEKNKTEKSPCWHPTWPTKTGTEQSRAGLPDLRPPSTWTLSNRPGDPRGRCRWTEALGPRLCLICAWMFDLLWVFMKDDLLQT